MTAPVYVPDAKPFDRLALGELPRMEWISIGLLQVDGTYQRSIRAERSVALIRRIAAEFDWRKFQPLSVAQRPSAVYVVIDGQHRLSAAALRGDIPELPCYIAASETMADEAAAFMALNRDRVQVHQAAMLRARAEAGDKGALQVIGVMAQAGIKLIEGQQRKTDPSSCTQAAGRIEKLIAKHGVPHVLDALRALAAAYPGLELRAPMISAVTSISHYSQRPIDLDRMARALSPMSQDDWIMYGAMDRLQFGSLPASIAFLVSKQYQEKAA